LGDDLRELYQQLILDHHSRPRNFGNLPEADHRAEGYNPLCGDRINVEVKLDDEGRLADVGFTGSGCAICTASASLMTDSVRGKNLGEAARLFEGFHDLVTGQKEPEEMAEVLGKLAVFAGVREFPIRVKCATLPWHTFQAALEGADRPVSTE
jgi:nitrogen fixation NifU-like protein